MGKLEEVRNLLLRSGVHSPLDYAEELSTKEATELAEQICKLFEQPIEFERGQGKHYEQHSWWWAGILIYGGNDDPAYRGNVWCSVINPDEMPKGICRNCGHGKRVHFYDGHLCVAYTCYCKKFLPAEPSAVEETIIYWKESFEAGKADCAKTHEALRNEGRREVVELIRKHSLQVKFWGQIWTTILTSELEDAEKEWGL